LPRLSSGHSAKTAAGQAAQTSGRKVSRIAMRIAEPVLPRKRVSPTARSRPEFLKT
jgi:hypothetical protein